MEKLYIHPLTINHEILSDYEISCLVDIILLFAPPTAEMSMLFNPSTFYE